MTAGTSRIPSMITRIVTLGIMAEGGGRPASRDVAGVALHISLQMVSRFKSCASTIAVAVTATPFAGCIVGPGATSKCSRRVAGRTIQVSGDMVRVGFRLCAYSCCAVMAGGTIVDDARVIKVGRREGSGSVADAAILSGGQVR